MSVQVGASAFRPLAMRWKAKERGWYEVRYLIRDDADFPFGVSRKRGTSWTCLVSYTIPVPGGVGVAAQPAAQTQMVANNHLGKWSIGVDIPILHAVCAWLEIDDELHYGPLDGTANAVSYAALDPSVNQRIFWGEHRGKTEFGVLMS